ncbi:HNH endonuclease [Wenxinia saemankumensis]|uniref:HNH endonuclease n=1 Tax=Wenxinia saemankumensis TaxID=1447782 RepID=A0A1M6EZH9_9RHOB|nr:HNH endonuclease [Wenxinia saemankumensis]SHI90801.1 HNH endonuclease [Wenxinia saemankumensis]
MGRLKSLGSSLSRLDAPLTYLPNDDRAARRNPLRHLYGTARWRRLSWDVRLAAAFTCAMCGRIEGAKGQTAADHIEPHRGDPALFWARSNLQCLCKPCHDGVKQAEEARTR